MEFVKTKDLVVGVKAVIARLASELAQNKQVLWLVCGGSGIKAEVEVLKQLSKHKDIENLAIMLMDERFGAEGHKDSNWQQLMDAGADFGGLYALPVLATAHSSLEQTVHNYERLTKLVVETADVIIGQFGLGADGHTAGMLPGSPAAKKSAPMVVGYDSPPFTRISMTFKTLSRVDVAYVFAFGDEKLEALENLKANKKPFGVMPSKLFWELPEVHIYNDQLGDA